MKRNKNIWIKLLKNLNDILYIKVYNVNKMMILIHIWNKYLKIILMIIR